jgi:hypothetical protein
VTEWEEKAAVGECCRVEDEQLDAAEDSKNCHWYCSLALVEEQMQIPELQA